MSAPGGLGGLDLLALLALVNCAALYLIHLLALAHSRLKLHRSPSQGQGQCQGQGAQPQPPTTATDSLPESPLPGVSVVKPLAGEDPNLSSNLETFFTMDYPVYELLFCVEEASDPAAAIVSSLMAKYPGTAARLFVGGAKVGVNPKINNMQPGFLAAKHDLVLISDSGIRMREDTLADMVAHMTEGVGLVHQMPFTCDRPGFAATVEKVYFGTVQARMYLAADLLRINCHVGMSSLVHRDALREIGGIAAFGEYLAEDFFLAKAIKERGWRLRVASQPAWQNSGSCSLSSFRARLYRWAQLRVAMLPHMILLEPFSECLVLGAATAWACRVLFGWEPLAVFLSHVLLWFLFDWILLSTAQQGPLPFSKFHFAIAWVLREVTGPALFLMALAGPHVRWRSREYRLSWGGRARELKPKAKY